MRQVKINDNVTLTIQEQFDSLIYFANNGYTKTGDKTHLEEVKKLENLNRRLA